MPAKLLEGKPIAEEIKGNLKKEIDALKDKYNDTPTLATVQVGENQASAVYLKSQQKNTERLGIEFKLHRLSDNTRSEGLIDYINKLNKNSKINGILIQLPLPAHINSKEITRYITPAKDVEGVHPENIGQVLLGEPRIAPCTAMATMELIKSTKINLYGKEAVVVGHSEIVGKPVSLLLLKEFATVTTCHIGTGERGSLADHVKRAEILVVAVGKAGLIKGEWIKDGAIVIDVGINRVGDKIVGDVEFQEAQKHASFITPVPGGVGPLTVTMLMKNIVEAFKTQMSIDVV